MKNIFIIWGAIQSGLGVAIGAFGAHAFKPYLQSIGKTDVFETAVKYQFYHAFGLFVIGLLYMHKESALLNWAGYSFGVGTIIFSGSLYLLCITNINKWGAVTPIGGLAFILGWIVLAVYAFKIVQ